MLNLRSTDFLSPNPVLCYGVGNFFRQTAYIMVKYGVNIVGAIDAYKTGSVKVLNYDLPIYTPEKASSIYGKNIIVIITINDVQTVVTVKKQLEDKGFSTDRIFDVNVFSWLTIPVAASNCPYLGREIDWYNDCIMTCCTPSQGRQAICEWFIKGQNFEHIPNTIMEKFAFYREESYKGRIPLFCQGCVQLKNNNSLQPDDIGILNFSDHTFCNADCVYCTEGCSIKRDKEIINKYNDRLKSFSTLFFRIKNIYPEWTSKGNLVLAGGEITVNPNKNLLYELADDMTNAKMMIFTNGIVYDDRIATVLKNSAGASLMCDLDAGTAKSYVKVKGFNRFYTVCENLKKYRQFGELILKYVIKPGWNDTVEDFQGTVNLLNELAINELILSPDFYRYRDNRQTIRDTLFATAKFVNYLTGRGLKAVITTRFWHEDHIAEMGRLANEIRGL